MEEKESRQQKKKGRSEDRAGTLQIVRDLSMKKRDSE